MAAADSNNQSHYASSTDYHVDVVANGYVSQFGGNLTYFDSEPGFDYLDIQNTRGTGGSTIHLTGSGGTVPLGWKDINFLNSSTALHYHFYSDYSVSGYGVALGPARVCSAAQLYSFAEYPVTTADRVSGVLLGPSDVVYLSSSVGSDVDPNNCSTADDTFALWGDTTAGNDFDMYVRCGSQPTPTQYDFRGFTAGTQEFVHATGGSCPCGSRWHIAIHSYSGQGWFNFVQMKHFKTQHRTSTAWSVACNVSSDTLTRYAHEVQSGLKHFFGANEGGRYFDKIVMTNNYGVGDGTIVCSNDTPKSDRCCTGIFCSPRQIFMYQNWMDNANTGPTVSHEMGHHYNCLGDEYTNQGDTCGHSIMDVQWLINTNYCWCAYQPPGSNKCNTNSGDHGWDQTPSGLSIPEGTAWINLAGSVPFLANRRTFDNYDFQNFDFHDLYATLVLNFL